jgi:hypothetical protein
MYYLVSIIKADLQFPLLACTIYRTFERGNECLVLIEQLDFIKAQFSV